MEIHNIMEDMVCAEVDSIFDSLKSKDICTCNQCRQDAVCYALNRTKPFYVVSHRGVSRVNKETTQQSRADLTALVYEGIKRVNHNQRPYFDHKGSDTEGSSDNPVFNIPAIMGQVFNGLNFSPLEGITVELLQNGKLVTMKDANWQNPYSLVANTGGTFTFLPKPVETEKNGTRGIFEFTIKITSSEFSELIHAFSIPIISELGSPNFSLARTHKLPDQYLFPPGEEKAQLIITE